MDDRLAVDDTALAVGFSVFNRYNATQSIALVSGQIALSYFKEERPRIAASVSTYSGATAAGATPTVCRLGIYREEMDGSLTLIGSTANQTTLWNAANTSFVRDLQVPVGLEPNQRYAYAQICVSAAAMPTLLLCSLGSAPAAARIPRLCARTDVLTDLPQTITAAQVVNTSRVFYGEIFPVASIGVQLADELSVD